MEPPALEGGGPPGLSPDPPKSLLQPWAGTLGRVQVLGSPGG